MNCLLYLFNTPLFMYGWIFSDVRIWLKWTNYTWNHYNDQTKLQHQWPMLQNFCLTLMQWVVFTDWAPYPILNVIPRWFVKKQVLLISFKVIWFAPCPVGVGECSGCVSEVPVPRRFDAGVSVVWLSSCPEAASTSWNQEINLTSKNWYYYSTAVSVCLLGNSNTNR